MMLRVIYIMLILLSLVACETLSDIELKTRTSDAVMTSFIYADSAVDINVYGSVSVLDSIKMSALGSGSVMLTTPNRTYKSYLLNGDKDVHLRSIDISEGDSVVLQVDCGEIGMKAKTYIPSKPQILSVDTVYNGVYGLLYFYVTILDSVSVSDYYQLVLRRNYRDNKGKMTSEVMTCNYYDYLFYQVTTGFSQKMNGLFSDETINGKSYTLKLSVSIDDVWANVAKDDSVAVEVDLYHHTEDYFKYAISLNAIDNYVLLPVFHSPVVYTNVEGGLGIVSGMSHNVRVINVKR